MPFPIEKHPVLAAALSARGYAEPTAVQRACLAPEAADRDLLVSAQTGSGKTVAYGLALASTILGELETLPATTAPLVLVIAPTRELALQVHAELTWLYAGAGGRIVSCVGGMDARREARALQAGCHIVVGTPGRLQDHLNRGALNLTECEAVVLDEADEMLDLGFKDELDFILAATPPSRRTLLFSATIAKEIAALARHYQTNALRIDTVARNVPHADIEYRALRIASHETEAALVNILRATPTRALVFCATRDHVRTLHANLQQRGFNAVALSGELSQNERNTALTALRDSRADVCIATDVAARGLDLPDLDLVIHADLPTNKETMLHRSGRTGRAGRKGISILLVTPAKRRRAEMFLASANITASWQSPPTAADILAADQQRLLADPLLSTPPTDAERPLTETLLANTSPEILAAALIRLYQSRLPTPADLSYQPPTPMTATPRQPRTAAADSTWFRAPVGRRNNADPKWLIPLICRQGNVTKSDIGAIKIFDRETKFEIANSAAESFAAAIAAAGPDDVPLTPTTPPGAVPAFDPGPRPPKQKPKRPQNNSTKPNEQERRRQNKAGKRAPH
jgi:ATP-dependent RNA helicase DeaD